MSVLAYIPARAGSKRIPRKNARLLAGKPVLARVIEAIRKAGVADEIAVSTDDAGIKRIAERAGAKVLALRSEALSDDRAPFSELLKKDVPRYLKAFGMKPEKTRVLFALATAALVPPALYRGALEESAKKKARVLVATVGYTQSPYRALVKKGGAWEPLFRDKLLMRSQDLPQTQVDAGLFYVLDYEKAVKEKRHWFHVQKGLVCFPVPAAVAVDVDTKDDWKELERKYRELHGTGHR